MAPPRPRDRGDFEIALICALQVEADAVHAVFDEFLEDGGTRYGQAPGDDNAYTTGVIGGHNVVLAYMPGMGKVSAAAVSVGLRSSFPCIKLALVVGVCGGVPYDTKKRTKIYLGDLIISTALIQYDFGRQYSDDHKRKDTLEDTLGRASPKIRAFLNKLGTKHYRRGFEKRIAATLEKIGQDDPDMCFPGADKDLLYQSDYVHQHHSSSPSGTCDTCDPKSGTICAVALELNCDDLKCEATKLDQSHNPTTSGQRCSPVVHFGRMGSGDTVLKSGLHRDGLAHKDFVIGFEMEGAGIWDQLPSIVMKGVCDYADSHKNKDWQIYAAAVAAAGVKAFLAEWNPSDHLLAYGRLHTERGRGTRSKANGIHSVSSDDESISSQPSHHDVQHLRLGKRRRLNEVESNLDDRLDKAIQASLSFQGMLERRNNIERQHRKTCEWILDLEEYRNWQNRQSGLLWIKGKPGAGKSTMMLFLYNTLCHERNLDEGVYLDFFFSARGNELQRVPLGMLRSLLNQLFCQDSRVRDTVRKSYLEKETTFGGANRSWDWQRRELEALLINAVMLSARRQPVNVFIDALDEAGEQAARELAQYFYDMNERVSEASGSVKVCISCRHYPIVSRLRGIEVCVEDHNHADITVFVYDRLHIQNTPMRNTVLTDSWHLLANDLVEQAHGVFQWVCLVLPMIEKSHDDGEPLEVCRQRLRNVPKELGDVYRYIIQNVINKNDRDRSFHLFQWVCLAERPLSVMEMRFAMASKDVVAAAANVRCCDTAGYIKEDELMKRQIRALSGGLIETEVVSERNERETRVQVIHQSVNDFLLSQGLAILLAYQTNTSATPSASSMPLSTSDVICLCQANLYYCCLSYLLTEDTGAAVQYLQSIPNSYRFSDLRDIVSVSSSPLIIYATVNLLVHAKKSMGRSMKPIEDGVRLLTQVVDRWATLYRAFNIYLLGRFEEFPHIGTNVLHAAAAANLVDIVNHLLRSDTKVDARDQKGYTALHFAAQYGHLAVVQLLFQAGCDRHQTTLDGLTPIVLAAGNGHLELVEWFVKHNATLEASARESESALLAAANSGAVMIVRYLLSAGADVNAQEGDLGTALQAASATGSEQVVQLLLAAGADVNAQGGEFDTALQAASFEGLEPIVQLLLAAGADVNAQGGQLGTALQAASFRGSEQVVQLLLAARADVNAQGGYFDTALQAASSTGLEQVVQLLLTAGANVNAQGGFHGTALQAASYRGSEQVVQLLLAAGANVNAQGGQLGTAIQAASLEGSEQVVQLLLTAGANVNAQGGFYGTALQAASYRGLKQVVQLLLKAGANVHIQVSFEISRQSKTIKSALHAASTEGHEEIVQLLRNAGAE